MAASAKSMAETALHEINRTLGELLAGQRATNSKIDSQGETIKANHSEAEKHWNDFYEKLREVNHATNNLAMADVGHVHALRNMGEKLGALEGLPEDVAHVRERLSSVERSSDQVESLTKRLSTIEAMAYKVAGIAAAVSVFCSILGAILIHFSSAIVHWMTGK